MRHIDKGCEPEYLTEHKDKWLEAFLASGKPRPDSKKYAHPKIVDALWSASNGKCFYCECSLDDKSKEVDHFIERSFVVFDFAINLRRFVAQFCFLRFKFFDFNIERF